MSETYKGKCPICGGRLVQSMGLNIGAGIPGVPIETSLLDCENLDYQCKQEDFEATWEKFNGKKFTQERADQLLVDLLTMNLKSHTSRYAPRVWLEGKRIEWNNIWDAKLAELKAAKSK